MLLQYLYFPAPRFNSRHQKPKADYYNSRVHPPYQKQPWTVAATQCLSSQMLERMQSWLGYLLCRERSSGRSAGKCFCLIGGVRHWRTTPARFSVFTVKRELCNKCSPHSPRSVAIGEFSWTYGRRTPTVMRFQRSETIAVDALSSDLPAPMCAIFVGGLIS